MDHKESFLQYLQIEKRYSPLTVRSYLNDLEQFDNHIKLLDLSGKPEDVSSHDVRSWIVAMIDNGYSWIDSNDSLTQEYRRSCPTCRIFDT